MNPHWCTFGSCPPPHARHSIIKYNLTGIFTGIVANHTRLHVSSSSSASRSFSSLDMFKRKAGIQASLTPMPQCLWRASAGQVIAIEEKPHPPAHRFAEHGLYSWTWRVLFSVFCLVFCVVTNGGKNLMQNLAGIEKQPQTKSSLMRMKGCFSRAAVSIIILMATPQKKRISSRMASSLAAQRVFATP